MAREAGELEERREAILDGEAVAFTTEQKARSGVVYDPTGRREPNFGVLRLRPEAISAEPTVTPKPDASLETPGDARVNELSTAMSAALRERVAREPDMALRLIIAGLHAKAWLEPGIPLKLVGYVDKPAGDSPVAAATGENRFAHALAWAMTQDVPTLLVYLAALVGPNVGVVRYGGSYGEGERALIDFVDPTVLHKFDAEAYFAGISKPLIALAWAEMQPALLRLRGRAQLGGEAPLEIPPFNASGKKGDMAAAAVIAAQLTGWLPPQLRTPSYDGPPDADAAPLREAAE